MNILGIVESVFKPFSNLIDNVHTSDEERLKLNNDLTKLKNEMSLKILEYEKQLLAERGQVIRSETQGQSWIQRNWRPITMLTFLFLVVCDSFGFLKFRLASEAWTLLQLGLGGYVVGRSCEKVIPKILKK